jgi:hypothetical protein
MQPLAQAGHRLNVPLLPGGGHQSHLDAFDLLVAPAIRAFAPDLIVVASGLDANAFDPLARMQATSGTFRALASRPIDPVPGVRALNRLQKFMLEETRPGIPVMRNEETLSGVMARGRRCSPRRWPMARPGTPT